MAKKHVIKMVRTSTVSGSSQPREALEAGARERKQERQRRIAMYAAQVEQGYELFSGEPYDNRQPQYFDMLSYDESGSWPDDMPPAKRRKVENKARLVAFWKAWKRGKDELDMDRRFVRALLASCLPIRDWSAAVELYDGRTAWVTPLESF